MQLGNVETRYSTNFRFIKDTEEGMHLENYGEYKQREINLLANLLNNNDGVTIVYEVGAGTGVQNYTTKQTCKCCCI